MLPRIMVLFLMLCFALPVLATDADNYTVTVPVANQSDAQRAEGFAAALQIVVDRLNTNDAQGQTIDLSVPMEHPEQYVASFSYITDPEQADAVEMNVRFDRQALKPFLPQQQITQSQGIMLQVTGVVSLSALNTLSDALRHINKVQSVAIEQVFNDKVDILVTFQGSTANLIQALVTNPHLTSMNTENTSDDQSSLKFQWTN